MKARLYKLKRPAATTDLPEACGALSTFTVKTPPTIIEISDQATY